MMDATSKTLWDTMSQASNLKGERNDCTVRAMTAATGLPYDVCHAEFAKAGRRKGCGVHFRVMGPSVAKKLGFNLRRMNRGEYIAQLGRTDREYLAKTMITAERDKAFKSGNFIALVTRHAAAIVDGKVIDWSQGKAKRLQEVYECTPIAGFTAPIINRSKTPNGSARWTAFTKYTKRDNLELF